MAAKAPTTHCIIDSINAFFHKIFFLHLSFTNEMRSNEDNRVAALFLAAGDFNGIRSFALILNLFFSPTADEKKTQNFTFRYCEGKIYFSSELN